MKFHTLSSAFVFGVVLSTQPGHAQTERITTKNSLYISSLTRSPNYVRKFGTHITVDSFLKNKTFLFDEAMGQVYQNILRQVGGDKLIVTVFHQDQIKTNSGESGFVVKMDFFQGDRTPVSYYFLSKDGSPPIALTSQYFFEAILETKKL